MEDKETRYREIYRFVEHYFWDHENPVLVIRNSRLYKEGYDAYGLSDEELYELKHLVLDTYKLSPLEIAELGTLFIRTGKHEFGLLAINLLKKHRPRLTREIFDIVRSWFEQGVENWSQADLLCSKILPVFLELELIHMDDLVPWRNSGSKWTRRAVPVTLLHLKNPIEIKVLLDFIAPLMNDRERLVQHGLGWFLKTQRENHPQEVEEFLHIHKKRIPKLLDGSSEPEAVKAKPKKKKFHKRPRTPAKPPKD